MANKWDKLREESESQLAEYADTRETATLRRERVSAVMNAALQGNHLWGLSESGEGFEEAYLLAETMGDLMEHLDRFGLELVLGKLSDALNMLRTKELIEEGKSKQVA